MTTDANRVLIFDTTLRDGEQSPGATMSHDEKLEIATLLDEMGVDIIEAGFPIASEGDFAAVSEIAKLAKSATICGLARANYKDIDRCWEAVKHAKSPRIHTFIGTSPQHRAIPNLTMDEMADRIHETVTHARNLCDNVQWSPMDATRTEWDYLKRVVEIAIRAGATTINIPDTVGYTAPAESAELIRRLIAECEGGDEVVFATHCHNDLGMATANALAAVAGGARQIECTINGLGERAGNTALEEVVMAMKRAPRHHAVDDRHRHHEDHAYLPPGRDGLGLRRAAQQGHRRQERLRPRKRHPPGRDAEIADTFEIMRPEDVGLAGTSLPLGKHSGRAALRAKLKDLGFDMVDNQLNDLFVRFKALADRKKEVFDDDLIALVTDAAAADQDDHLELKFLRVICGTEAPQSADITLRVGEKDMQATAQGDGPVDAAFNAVKALYPNDAVLQLYQVSAVTEGMDAQATVSVRIEEDGRIATGQSADTDTVVASVKAYVNALNRLIVRREKLGSDKREVSYKDVS
jgi:2-isopropylmalate synthase